MKWLVTGSLFVALAACGDNNPGSCDPTAPNTICTIAGHSLKLGYKGDNGPATSADLYIPMDSAIAPDGTLWFIDFNNYVVRQIDDKGIIHTVVGNGQLGDSPASDGLMSVPALQAFNNHTPTMVFASGYLWFASWHESRIKRVDLATMSMTNVAGRATRGLYDGDGADPMKAALSLPSSIAFDPAGNLVVMDQENQVVRKIDMTANTISTIAGQCIVETASSTIANGCVPVACPSSEKMVCGDPTMLCDSNHVCTPAFAGDGGPALQARLGLPGLQTADPTGGIAFDHNGNLLIADTLNHRIRKVDPAGNISTLVGDGTAGYAGDGGPAAQAEINHPVHIAVGDDNTVYFTDVFNHCVRAVDSSGNVRTVAGVCHFEPEGGNGTFAGDGGDPLQAQLNKPYMISISGSTLYVADSYNNRLRVVNLP